MSDKTRTFSTSDGSYKPGPVLLALSGPQGVGKTLSALRLAHGLVSVTGGDVWVVDTENERAREYGVEPGKAPQSPHTFAFRHLDFQPPFNGRAYRDALLQCQAAGAGCVIFDSVSHEHAGEGGRIEHHARECERLMKAWRTNDIRKVEWPAWNAPSEERRAFLWALGRRTCHVILCFRAKDSTAKGEDGKVFDAGWTPIGAEEYLFEVDSALPLPPQCNGVPSFRELKAGELAFVRLKRRARGILNDGEQLSEDHGRRLAIAAGWKVPSTSPSLHQTDVARGGGADAEEGPPPAPPPPSSEDFPGDIEGPPPVVRYGHFEYVLDQAPELLELEQSIDAMDDAAFRELVGALIAVAKRAPRSNARAWIDMQTPHLIRIRARDPARGAQIEAALPPSASPSPGADRDAGGSGGTPASLQSGARGT